MTEHTHHHDEMCRLLLRELSAYLDGEADASLCREIERHIAECENCRIVVDTLGRTITLYRTSGHARLPHEARERLYATLDLSECLRSGDD